MTELLIISVTQHTHQNRVSDIITHVTLNTINDVALSNISSQNHVNYFVLIKPTLHSPCNTFLLGAPKSALVGAWKFSSPCPWPCTFQQAIKMWLVGSLCFCTPLPQRFNQLETILMYFQSHQPFWLVGLKINFISQENTPNPLLSRIQWTSGLH